MRRIGNIAVVGVGGVGGYFGGKLCRLLHDGGDCSVFFVARGEHLQAIRKSGLILDSETDGEVVCKPSLATDDFLKLPPLDLCLLCVKEFDLAPALSSLRPLIGNETVLLPLLNGVDVSARVRSVIENGIVLPACVYVGTHLERPGKVSQRGGACQILFGPDPRSGGFTPDEVLRAFDRANINSRWTLDIQVEIWKKFIFICAYGLVTAAYNKTVGQVLEEDSLRSAAQEIIKEAIDLARGCGVHLPEDSAEAALFKARSFPYGAKTSFQRDFERADERDERDLFAGAMIRMAAERGLAIPKTIEIAALLEKQKPAG
jgi:2-dehydropantoate 2-reductase